jgi:hypothetical protein
MYGRRLLRRKYQLCIFPPLSPKYQKSTTEKKKPQARQITMWCSNCCLMPCTGNNVRPSRRSLLVRHIKQPPFEDARPQISQFWPIYTLQLATSRLWEFIKHPYCHFLSYLQYTKRLSGGTGGPHFTYSNQTQENSSLNFLGMVAGGTRFSRDGGRWHDSFSRDGHGGRWHTIFLGMVAGGTRVSRDGGTRWHTIS